jgi:hypothetical protein
MLTAGFFIVIWYDLHKGWENRPFFLSIGVFFTSYIGPSCSAAW